MLDSRATITPELLRRVMVSQNAAFIRIAGGPVATCHDKASELRRAYIKLLQHAREHTNKSSSDQAYGSTRELDPFAEADSMEKDRERLIGDLKRSSVTSNPALAGGGCVWLCGETWSLRVFCLVGVSGVFLIFCVVILCFSCMFLSPSISFCFSVSRLSSPLVVAPPHLSRVAFRSCRPTFVT